MKLSSSDWNAFPFCHADTGTMCIHISCFYAVVDITQLMIQNGESLYALKFNDEELLWAC